MAVKCEDPCRCLRRPGGERRRSTQSQNILLYVLQMRERLKSMAHPAQQNLEQAQQRQRTYYDQKATARCFEPGDQVLVMVPSDTSK